VSQFMIAETTSTCTTSSPTSRANCAPARRPQT
jgi:hypothetical protein